MKKAGMDMKDLEEGQAHLDRMKVAQICANAVGSGQQYLFHPFPQELTQKALVALLSRPWFKRTWVIQEFVVAEHVDMYCGRRSVEWASFLTAFCYSFNAAKVRWDTVIPSSQRIDFYRGMKQMLGMHSMWNGIHDRESHRDRLLVLLSSCRTANATLAMTKFMPFLDSLIVLNSRPTITNRRLKYIYALQGGIYTRRKTKSYYTKLPDLIEHQATYPPGSLTDLKFRRA